MASHVSWPECDLAILRPKIVEVSPDQSNLLQLQGFLKCYLRATVLGGLCGAQPMCTSHAALDGLPTVWDEQACTEGYGRAVLPEKAPVIEPAAFDTGQRTRHISKAFQIAPGLHNRRGSCCTF